MKLNLLEGILFHLFKSYTYKIYIKGFKDGFNWNNKMNR